MGEVLLEREKISVVGEGSRMGKNTREGGSMMCLGRSAIQCH